MRRTSSLLLGLMLAGCAGFEPRVSVQTHEPPPANGGATTASTSSAPTSPSADYVVARGDTLYGIAFRNKLDFRDLAAWNNIGAPYTIYPGQGLRLSAPSPTSRVRIVGPEPASAAAPVAPAVPPGSVAQRVEAPVPIQLPVESGAPVTDSGATQTFAVSDADPTTPTSALEVSQPVVSAPPSGVPPERSPAVAIGLAPNPPATPSAPVVATGTQATAATVSPVATPPTQAPSTVTTAPAQEPAAAATTADYTPRPVQQPDAPTRARDGLRWRWPAGGALIGRFVEGDPTQQGIDIGGRLGEAVLAAADGEVVYSGNGLIGYGELVIVQHSPGFLSAYGHNQKRLVREGSKVKAGQPIAEMGRRGGIDMLHFEIRRNGKPVDPLGYLPQR